MNELIQILTELHDDVDFTTETGLIENGILNSLDIVTLITATRKHPALALGASPRASVALVHLAQAYAFLRGRDYVLPDDIAGLFRAAIAHRLMLRQEAKLAHQTTQDVLTEILRTTEVPYKGKRA